MVLFAGGDSSDACYDDASCTARQLNTPDKMSSTKFNATLSPKGIFSTSGEENPNFYGFRTVFVPYCSSDLWLGNRIEASTLSFRGRAIVVAVLEDLKATTFSPTAIPTPEGPGPSKTRFDQASSVTVVGGAGIISLFTGAEGGPLAALIPPKPRAHLKLLCDGCVIAPVEPLISVDKQPCTSAADCPPSTVLQKGLSLWTSQPHAPEWRSLLADTLLRAVHLPMLVQQQLYDATQLTQNRAWPAAPASSTYIATFGHTMQGLLRQRPHGGRFTFGTACSNASPSLLRDTNGFFCRPISCVLQQSNSSAHLRLAGIVSMFLRDPEFEPVCIDECEQLDCNAFCTKPSCWG